MSFHSKEQIRSFAKDISNIINKKEEVKEENKEQEISNELIIDNTGRFPLCKRKNK